MASKAVLAAVIACSKGDISNRMQMTTMFPEMNPGMDSYRIGTLLELARSIAITLAEQNLRVRICVQGMMGVGIFTGIPKQLSGVSILLERMDWQSVAGEENEGMVGNYINFGEIGKEHVVNSGLDREGNEIFQDDVFLLLCPQSMIGTETSIIGALDEMVEAAGDRPVILINPDLTDKVSSQGQQNIRGRKDRIEFADSFKTIYHFRNIYVSGTSYFPILGAVNKPGHEMPWVAYQRRDWANDGGEIYVPALSTEEEPEGYLILETFD
jgi:adenylate kinase